MFSKFLSSVAILTSTLFLFPSGILPGVAYDGMDASPDCYSNVTIGLDELSEVSDPRCDYEGVFVDVGGGRLYGIPKPGFTLGGEDLAPAGTPEIPGVVIHRMVSGELGVIVGSRGYGSMDAVQQAQSLQTSSKSASFGIQSQCSSYAYATYGWSWAGSYQYWYNSTNQPSSAALTRINAGIAAMPSGQTACGTTISNTAVADYQTTSSYTPSVTSSGCSGTNDSHSTVGWGSLSGTTLARTCWTSFLGLGLDADIKFDTSGHSWYYGTSTTGCTTSLYDLQAVATHEAGHAFGLDHVAQSTGQVMKPFSSTCETQYRKLGNGDATGMAALY